MRKLVGMVSLAALAACSGTDPQSAGSLAAGGAQTAAAAGTFVAPTQTKTYKAVGAVQSYGYSYGEAVIYSKDIVRDAAGKPVLDANGFPTRALNTDTRTLVAAGQTAQLYQANAATVRNPGITVSYDPRNAQFTLTIAQDNVSQNITFQDPAHRTDFGGAIQPQNGVPNIAGNPGIKYLQVGLSTDPKTYDAATFFYEQPGTSTKYVTYAGYVRNRTEAPTETVTGDNATSQTSLLGRKTQLDRATFVFGEQTDNSAVPVTGTATYTGNMIASMANNPDFENSQQTYFQWITGTQKTTVDFAAASVSTTLAGTVGAPLLDTQIGASTIAGSVVHNATPIAVPSSVAQPSVPIPQNSTFAATASAHIDLVGTGGFTGSFSDARFSTPAGAVQKVAIAGSSVDGAFYGPKADEIGASFRIVGGVPDQRVDVVGAFTGAKP